MNAVLAPPEAVMQPQGASLTVPTPDGPITVKVCWSVPDKFAVVAVAAYSGYHGSLETALGRYFSETWTTHPARVRVRAALLATDPTGGSDYLIRVEVPH